ncbi:16S rRNA (cytosine(1402)-N(4))-methyltransferase RsmH [Amedibacillus dolichus]|uniref:Ribosomal RNA small subunit methyltransferase H n=1 Tax=Amedibacillus dolichus TaxID=31971 RepID=A0A415PQS3_9FIRM|nr:16S rRNA (cytosine(1402)-N(4))-methyltransferase RsmH [Amedibacillus dolichus]RHM15048.1 16S rRNA (cytosine(1402)-N(4))-methyltransferase RsmH [Amedibacillus dolichus]
MSKHYSVLLSECLEGLVIRADGIYVDGTLGRGGHSAQILQRIPKGHLYAFDRDETAIKESKERLLSIASNFTLIHNQFSMLKEELSNRGIYQIDGMLLDLGVSSPQFDDGERGFSYRYDAPLDMRMDQSQQKNAYDVVNSYDYHELVRIFYQYGEEKFAKQIAKNIEKQRAIKPIATTFELVEVIKASLPAKVLNKKGHPAKKVFQAIRIEVNDELKEIETVLQDAMDMLAVGGRLCVISFQSLEDRIVKEAFHERSTPKKVDKRIPMLPQDIETVDYRLVNRKPIIASEEELEENNRSHSAKLRIIERVG